MQDINIHLHNKSHSLLLNKHWMLMYHQCRDQHNSIQTNQNTRCNLFHLLMKSIL